MIGAVATTFLLTGAPAAAATGLQFDRAQPAALVAEPPLPAPRVEPGEIAATFNRGGVPVLNHDAINRVACRMAATFFLFPEVAAAQCKVPVLDEATRALHGDVALVRSVNRAAVTVVCRSGSGWLDVRVSSRSYGEMEGIVAAAAVDLRGGEPEWCNA
jgi:hypothetical protein